MTVSSQTSTATFVGNGVATAFPLPFRFFENGDIRAYFIDSVTGAATQMVLGTDYTLIGSGEPEVDGNALSLLTTTTPLASMRGLYVERVMQQVQGTDIVNQGQFFASTHEDVFDRLTMLIQQANANSAGAIRVAIGDPEPSRLPSAVQRANLLMGFDEAGNPVASFPVADSATDLAMRLADNTDPMKGAALVGYKGRTAADRLGDVVSVKDFGASGGGVLDDSLAIQMAINVALSRSVAVLFPAGTYKINSTILLSMTGDNSLSIIGDGSGVSVVLVDTGANGFDFTLPGNYSLFNTGLGRTALSVSGITFATTAPYVGSCFKLNGTHVSGRPSAETRFSDVCFTSYSAGTGQFFEIGVELINCSFVKFESCFFYMGSTNTVSKGIYSRSSNIVNGGGALHLTDCQFTFGGKQLHIGDQQEGVYVTNCEFIAGSVGITYEPDTAQSGLHVLGGHMASIDYNIYLHRLYHFEIVGGLYFSRGTNANFIHIYGDIVNRFTISGNVFESAGGVNERAISIGSTPAGANDGSVISGNSFHGFPAAIYLSSAANFVREVANIFRGCTLRVSNPSSTGTNIAEYVNYHKSAVFTLVGGATFEDITVVIPAGLFIKKPESAFIVSNSNNGMVGFYNWTSSTPEAVIFTIRRNDAGTIPAAAYRFTYSAYASNV